MLNVNQRHKDLIVYLMRSGRPVLPLRKYQMRDGQAIGLRHDVDKRIDIAHKMAKYERKMGICSTYFIRHTAEYFAKDEAWALIMDMQDMGHEIGFHNDLLSELVAHPDIVVKERLESCLCKMWANGIDVHGTSAHGSHLARTYRFLNGYVWREVEQESTHPQFNQIETPEVTVMIPKLKLDDWFEYEANLIDPQEYYSDADGAFDMLELERRMGLCPKIQVSVHPNKQPKGELMWLA